MSKVSDKRARTRLLALYPSLQHQWARNHVDQWVCSPLPIDRKSLDILARTILQYVVSVPLPLQRRQFLHDAELIEDVAAEIFPPKVKYVRKRGGKAA